MWFRVLRERSGEEMSAIRDSLWGTMSSEMEVEVKWDVQELDSAYLCENIDMAFKAWREQPWGKNVDFETFCEYILPYRIDDESPVIWRKAYYEKFNPMLDEFRNSGMFDEEDPVEALKFLMKKLPILYEPKYSQDGLVNFPHIGPEYVQYVSGSCREYSDFVIYVCRSLGIPCAFNQVFNMHRVNVGHCWANFWNKYGEEYIISNYPPVLVPNRQDYTLATPKHKVYRRTYSINCGQLEKVKTSSEPLSYFFSIPTYKDVTAIYTNRYLPELSISVKSLNVELQENRPVYLCSSNRMDWFPEDGPAYPIRVAILKDRVTAGIDTTGVSLHKRGYRKLTAKAPITETLAAALLMLTPWKKDRILADPFCGSGTFAIEAAMMAADMAPGMHRSFQAQQWKNLIPEKSWTDAREEAQDRLDLSVRTDIRGYDIDESMIRTAEENARAAGVEKLVSFRRQPVSAFAPEGEYGFLIANPPYGERLEEKEALPELYRTLGERFALLDTWSMYLITGYEDAQRYIGKTAWKNRKIYNGMLKTYFYQYPGPRPPKKEKL